MAESGNTKPNVGVPITIPRTWKMDLLFFSVSLALVIILALLLYMDLLGVGRQATGEPVAHLSFRERRVERKIGGDVIWSRIGAPDQIYNYDSIRTEDGSQARVSLSSGTELVLDGAALVSIIIDEEKTSVDLKKGYLSLVSAPAAPVEIQSVAGLLRLENGATVSLKQGDDGLQVDLLDGEAVFEGSNGTTKLEKNQSLQQDKNGATEVKAIPFKALNPAPVSLNLIFSDTAPVQFNWISNKFAASTIEISSSQDFSRGVQSYFLSNPQSFQTQLSRGTWYWRISNGQEKSPISSFNLVQDEKPNPLAPESGKVFSFIDHSPLVRLQWQKSNNATLYHVNIFNANNLAKPLRSITSQYSSISLDGLREGSYVWQVEGDFTAFQEKVQGGQARFQVRQVNFDNLPEPEINLDDLEVSLYALEKNSVIITWNQVEELNSYLAELSLEDEVVQREVVNGTFFKLSSDLQQGEYNLKITALNNGELVSSQSKNFSITTFGVLKFLTPQNNSRYYNTDSQISFRWHDANKGKLYLLEVSSDPDFSQIRLNQETANTFLSVPNFDLGRYYCRVSLLDENGQSLVSSQPTSFLVEQKLSPPPVLKGPVLSGTVDLTIYGSLNFEWDAVPGADFYRLTIIPKSSPTAARTWDISSTFKEETDVLTLPLGPYRYSLTAFRRINGKEIPVSRSGSGTFELKRSLTQKVTKIEIF